MNEGCLFFFFDKNIVEVLNRPANIFFILNFMQTDLAYATT